MSPRPCRSANRCSDLQCLGCVWRYCRFQAIRILNQSTGPLYTISLTIPDPSPEGFRASRVELRNRVDYLRRTDLRWRKCGFHGWLQRDGTVRCIASLGMLGRGEVEKGLERWSATLGPEIGHDDLRVAIWGGVKPSAVFKEAGGARYQGIKLNIWPRRDPVRPKRACSPFLSHQYEADPMPVAF
jgi:hypothetical protein